MTTRDALHIDKERVGVRNADVEGAMPSEAALAKVERLRLPVPDRCAGRTLPHLAWPALRNDSQWQPDQGAPICENQ